MMKMTRQIFIDENKMTRKFLTFILHQSYKYPMNKYECTYTEFKSCRFIDQLWYIKTFQKGYFCHSKLISKSYEKVSLNNGCKEVRHIEDA